MGFGVGRVTAEHKERYIVMTDGGEVQAEVTGNLRFSARNREDFPAVGDWVALIAAGEEQALIHKVLPRTAALTRQAVGQHGEVQLIAANIDYAFLVQALDRDFNLNRLDRYLTLCYAARVSPVIVLTKADLCGENHCHEVRERLQQRHPEVPFLVMSAVSGEGLEELRQRIEAGKTYCLLGSSGAGKSTLLNHLAGGEYMHTRTLSESTNKGRHTTTHRELVLLKGGGLIIDNPGMREVGITDGGGGLEATFDRILDLARQCRYADCTHTRENGCAVLHALEQGEIDADAWDNYLRLERERAHFETEAGEKKRREKLMGKVIKDYYKKDFKRRRGDG